MNEKPADDRCDCAINVNQQYAEENIGLKRQLALASTTVEQQRQGLAEAAMRIEELEAQVKERNGICETAIAHIEAAKAGGWETPGVCYGLVKVALIDAALNDLGRAR